MNTTEAGPLSKRREFTWWYYPDRVNPTIRYGFILLYRKNNPSFTYMICHRTSTNPSAWQVLCSIIQGRCLILVDYNEKRMQSNGDDLIFFGKYRGHFLHEILKVDPAYLSWIAYKFTPRIPKQERFVKIAQAYHSVHLDLMQRKSKEKHSVSRYLGELGEKLTDLRLKVIRVRLEDDPYKTRINGTVPQFFVKQVLTLADASGNLVIMSIPSKNPSAVSCTLSGIEHEYRPGEIIYVASARVSRRYESYGSKYTRISHVKLVMTTTV